MTGPRRHLQAALVCTAVLLGGNVAAQTLSGDALVTALRGGGHVIVMRHASSPRQPPATGAASPDNVGGERELDGAGRDGAAAMGDALRRLKIPVGTVLSSPTYRAMQTARFAQLPEPRPVEELGDGPADSDGAWLKQQMAALPSGTNTILITHMPNIGRAFPGAGATADGEALVFGPDGQGGTRLVGRVRIEEWPGF